MKLGKCAYPLTVLLLATVLVGICRGGSRLTAVMVENLEMRNRTVIVIDPGHGGVDGGATSCTGKLESGYNLQISLRLRDLFHLLGCRTTMIRTSDTSVYTSGETIAQQKMSDLKERVRITNTHENAILVSIHQNNFSDSRYSGAQVFYAGTDGSRELALAMQTSFVETLNPGSNRKCKQASGIYLMEHIQCPGVLVECGFLSNPGEEAKLSGAAYQQKLCCVIAASVCSFLESTYANT